MYDRNPPENAALSAQAAQAEARVKTLEGELAGQERAKLALVQECQVLTERLEVHAHYLNRDLEGQIADAYEVKQASGYFPWEDAATPDQSARNTRSGQ